jgi:hypothetical protein
MVEMKCTTLRVGFKTFIQQWNSSTSVQWVFSFHEILTVIEVVSSEILDWLCAPGLHPKIDQEKREVTKDTGTWILRHEKYQEWKSNAGTFLWLNGPSKLPLDPGKSAYLLVGCGKSMLTYISLNAVTK